MRNTIIECGGEVHFQTRMDALIIKNNEVLPMEELLTETRKEYCQYLVFREDQQMDRVPEACGLICKAKMDGYVIYEDPEVTEIVTEWKNIYGV